MTVVELRIFHLIFSPSSKTSSQVNLQRKVKWFICSICYNCINSNRNTSLGGNRPKEREREITYNIWKCENNISKCWKNMKNNISCYLIWKIWKKYEKRYQKITYQNVNSITFNKDTINTYGLTWATGENAKSIDAFLEPYGIYLKSVYVCDLSYQLYIEHN